MAKKKSKKLATKSSQNINNYNRLVSLIKQKYPYLILGLTIILILYFIITGLTKKPTITQIIKEQQKKVQTQDNQKKNKVYITKTGDSLWSIAESTYGSGYNAYDIAKANNIENPNIIYSGIILKLPTVTPKAPTRGEIAPIATTRVTLTADKYTVRPGDYLWAIAERAYGDGFSWVKIAKANHIQNPDIIYANTVLDIPR